MSRIEKGLLWGLAFFACVVFGAQAVLKGVLAFHHASALDALMAVSSAVMAGFFCWVFVSLARKK